MPKRNPSWFQKGHKHSPEIIAKISKNRTKLSFLSSKCKNCETEFKYKRYEKKGIFCSLVCTRSYGARTGQKNSIYQKTILSKKFKGNGNPSWRGGVTPLRIRLRNTPEYKLWRKAVFERDNYTCQECGQRGRKLEADHITPYMLDIEGLLNISNGQTLCKDCHKEKTKNDLKRNWSNQYSSSKSISKLTVLALVSFLTSVFLVGLNSPKVYAEQSLFDPTPISSPLEDNQKKIDQVKEKLETKTTLIEEKTKEVKKVKTEAQQIVEKKESLQKQVKNVKAEVRVLKAKVAEKKRIEALRIVKIKKYALNHAGNLYVPGNCTWYAKSRRPDIGNRWGNADNWVASARAAGFKTGTQSKKGAIGMTKAYMHVVYVEEWYKDGTVLVSEMNYEGLGVVSKRKAPESEFIYIYEKP